MYQITVKYWLTPSQRYEARIATRLPSVSGQGIEKAYIGNTVKLHGESLDFSWGVGAGGGFTECRHPVTITKDTVEELATAVSAKLFEIQKTIHEVYVTRIDKQALLPKDISLEIDPAFLRIEGSCQTAEAEPDFAIVELNSWRNRITEGDKIRVWISEESIFVSGFVQAIDRSTPEWELEIRSVGGFESWAVDPHDLFPYFLSESEILLSYLPEDTRHAETT
jgi:hypothetical protein